MAADWSNLLPDLLELVAKRLQIKDIVRMKASCRQWRSVMKERAFYINNTLLHTNKTQLPWLLFPCTVTNDSQVCRFYSFKDSTTSRLSIPKRIAGANPLICGSSYGWLVIRDACLSLLVLNPLTRKHISLPPVNALPSFYHPDFNQYSVHKVILSENPSSLLDNNKGHGTNWMAIAMFGRKRTLVFAQPGDLKWRYIDVNWTFIGLDYEYGPYYDDMVIWKEQLYVIRRGTVNLGVCSLKIMNNNSNNDESSSTNTRPKLDILELALPEEYPHPYYQTRNYLVVSSSGDDLLLVCRKMKVDDDFHYRTNNFLVYKLEFKGTVWKWKKMETIGNEIIFLGINHSISLPAFAECEANCIYYTDDLKEGIQGILGGQVGGIFNIVSRQFRSLPGCPRSTRLIWPPPLWFTPSLW